MLAHESIKEHGGQNNVYDKCQNNQQLYPGCFLNILFCLYIANLAGAVLRFLLVNHAVNSTGQTNPEHRFKKQEYKAH